MASDADKTMSEAQPRRPRRRQAPASAAAPADRPRRRRGAQEPTEEAALAVTGKGRATPSRRATEEAEEKTGNIVTRRLGGLRDYFDGVGAELRKVTWPSQEDLRRLSIIVILTLIVTAIALGLISFVFTELFRLGLASPIILIVFMAVAIVVGLVVSRMNARRSNS